MANDNKIAEAYVEVKAKFDKLQGELNNLKKKTDKKAAKAGKSAGGKFSKGFQSSIGKIGLAIGGMFAVQKITSWVGGILKAQDSVQKLSIRLGETTNFLSEMQYVADLSGVSIESMNSSIERANRRLAEYAETGGGEAADAMKKLGINVKDADGRIKSFENLLPEFANKFAQVQDQATKVNLAFKLFGREGVSFLQILDSGADGITEMRKEAQKLGLSLDRGMVDNAAETRDQITKMNYALRGLGNIITSIAAGPLASFADGFATVLVSVNEMVKLLKSAAFYQFAVSSEGMKYWKNLLIGMIKYRNITQAAAEAGFLSGADIAKFFNEIDNNLQSKSSTGNVKSDISLQRSTNNNVSGGWRKNESGFHVPAPQVWKDYQENIKNVKDEYFQLIETYPEIEENSQAFWESLTEDTQGYMDAAGVMFDSMVAGFDAMFNDIIKIQTSSNNTFIKGVTAMANAFTQAVTRMIAKWIAFKAVVGLMNFIVPGSGTGFAAMFQPQMGAATGADFVVPPGYPSDTFTMGLTSGEHVSVTPSAGTSSQDKLMQKMISRLDILASYAGVPLSQSALVVNGKIDGYDIKLAYDKTNKVITKIS